MLRETMRLIGLVLLAACVLFPLVARADDKEVKPKEVWDGSVDDVRLMKEAPLVVTNPKVLEKLWKAWKVDEVIPEVDFAKEIILVQTTPPNKGPFLDRPKLTMDQKGDLWIQASVLNKPLRGFRYWIFRVSRDGIKTFGRKPLPTD